MIKFIAFLKRIYVLLLFILLETLCLHYYAGSTAYTKSQLLTFSNNWLGRGQKGVHYIFHYFTLGKENKQLAEQVALLRTQLATYQTDTSSIDLSTMQEFSQYVYMSARVVGNSVTKQENFLTLNKGFREDVEADMAVISPDGSIVGYVLSCSDKFASCISVLNKNFHTSGKFKNADYVGGVSWDGVNASTVLLSDIPKHAEIHKGDTIVTSSYSSIFPPGMMIGTVDSWSLNDLTYCYDVKVTLSARISSLRDVILIRYVDAAERSALEAANGY